MSSRRFVRRVAASLGIAVACAFGCTGSASRVDDASDAGPVADAGPTTDAVPPRDVTDQADACAAPVLACLPTASGGGHFVARVFQTAIDDCSPGAMGATIVTPDLVDGGHGDFGSVAVDDRVLLFTMIRYVGISQTWELRSVPVTGGGQTTLAAGSNDFPSIALYNHEAYWGERSSTDGGSYTFTIRARDEGGSGAARDVMSGDGGGYGLAVGDGFVFAASVVYGNAGVTTTIVKGPASGGVATRVATFNADLGFLTIRDATLYWTEDTRGGFEQVVRSSLRWQPTGGGATMTVVDANLPIRSVALTDRHAYWLTTGLQSPEGTPSPLPSEWHLYSELRAGGNAQEIASEQNSDYPELFAEGSVLEWVTRAPGLHVVCD